MSEPLEFDYVIIVCKGCGRERTHHPDQAFSGAEQLIAFMKSEDGLARYKCDCGSSTCNLKAHMKGDPCLSCGEKKAVAAGAACTTPEFHS